MDNAVNLALAIQKLAWKNGHDNYGAAIDVKASALNFLTYFKHLNPKQKELLEHLQTIDELKYAKKLCSRANKSVRHFIVKLK